MTKKKPPASAEKASVHRGRWLPTAKQRRKFISWTLWVVVPLLAAYAIAALAPQDVPDVRARYAAARTQSGQVNAPLPSADDEVNDSSGEAPPADTWDKPEECQAWAGSGQCKENPGFMLVNCAFSCAKLDYAQQRYHKRCPKPPGHASALEPGQMSTTFARIMSDFAELEPEMISDDPPVVLFHKFFSDAECDAFIRHGKGRYAKSLGVGMKADGTMGDVKTEIRTSSHGWCQHAECLGDPAVQAVIARVADVTQTPATNAEYAQLVYYHACPAEGDPSCAFYKQHNDYIDSDEHKLQGPRIYTLFGYMNDVLGGGGTRFTSLPNGPITFQPQRGKAILWPSVLEHAPTQKDNRTDHEALPVLAGEKFGANFWIHQHDFKGAHASGCTHEK